MKNFGELVSEKDFSIFDYFKFNPEEAPSPVKEVVFLKGSWREMGLQYGQQAKDALHRKVAFFLQLDLAKAKEYSRLYEDLEKYVEHYQKYFPEFIELMQGMAEGAELGFYDIVATYTIYVPQPTHNCSHVSAWGEATGNGKIIGGANWDYEGNLRMYEPAVVAFPEDGHAFISSSGICTNSMINDAGLMVLSSGGQNNRPEDHKDIGFQYMVGFLYLSAKCKDAEEAKEALLHAGISSCMANNVHIVDADCHAFMLEHTAAGDEIRHPGDFGEKDYLVATNHFITEKMKPALYTGDMAWVDCQYRYDTEERILLDDFGHVNLDTINNSLGSNRYIDGDKWIEDVWSFDPVGCGTIGEFCPENTDPLCKCVMRGLIDVKARALYIMAGCRNVYVSERPYATGNFSRLMLKDSIKKVVSNAKTYAQSMIFTASRDLSAMEKADKDRALYLNRAKETLYAGLNYMNLADCAKEGIEKLSLYSKAVTKFCYAQCYGQLAQDDPLKVVREEMGSEWEELI